MKKRESHPTPEEAEHVNAALREMKERLENRLREAAEFKPGQLTPEEAEMVRREGLTALNYIPQRVIQEQRESQERWEKAGRRKPVKTPYEQLEDRFQFGQFWIPIIILGVTAAIIDIYDWRIGSLCCLLMVAVFELSYRLSRSR
jgi:hypothetical protein